MGIPLAFGLIMCSDEVRVAEHILPQRLLGKGTAVIDRPDSSRQETRP
jgi:hypothetical protein